jgi:hypothetical protein
MHGQQNDKYNEMHGQQNVKIGDYSVWGMLLTMRRAKFLSNNPSGRNMALESTQPLTEMSTWNIP